MPGNARLKPSPEPLKPISKIILVVHPFWSLREVLFTRAGVNQNQHIENAHYLMNLWTRQLRKVAKSPGTITLVVSPSVDELKDFRPSAKRVLDRFMHAAEALLGNRLFVQHVSADPSALHHAMIQRGFRLDRKWKGRAFGEFFRQCVYTEAAKFNLPRHLWKFATGNPHWVRKNTKGTRMISVPSLSIEGQHRLDENSLYGHVRGKALGHMHQRLRPTKKK